MLKPKLLLIILVISLIVIPSSIIYLKNEKIKFFNESDYQNRVDQSKITLKTLIKEKQNTTATIAIGLSKNSAILESLKDINNQTIDLKEYSLDLRNTTEFKNVWFQLINKEGISLQRSWTDYKGDKVSNVRSDLQKLLKNPTIMNTISIGKFDMTFKSINPVYDKDKKFLGFVEVITHFNSIAKKLENANIKSIILGDKRYKKQITKPFTKKFLKEYYIANIDADVKLLKYFETVDLDGYISKLSKESYIIDERLNLLVSYYKLDNIQNKPMGHFLMFQSLEHSDHGKIKETEYFYNIILLISILILLSLLYFNIKIKEYTSEAINKKLLLLFTVLFIVIFGLMFKIISNKYNSDIDVYKKNLLEQSILEYNSILSSNKSLAQLVFSREIDTKHIKSLIKNKNRKALYEYLKDNYKDLQKQYNVRQIHFHLPDSTSFLRMHRPNKYGDSLKGIRNSVDYVNRVKKPYIGFEEGRIYNGFRYVFPMFDNNEHLGSVEVSFDIYYFIDSYIELFKVERVNFLINKDIVDEKVFKSEKSNYLNSPIEGFYFDKIVVEKLDKLDKPIIPKKKNKEKLASLSKDILKGNPFVVHFEDVSEVTMIIPLVNKISGKIAGSIHISKSAKFIENRKIEFYELIVTVFVVLAFIMIFAYREVLSKIKLNNELNKNQLILDSQSSFIIITDGTNIKASNKSLLEFFGYLTLDEFKKAHDCVCDYFEEEKGFISKQMGELNWFEYISQNSDIDNMVKMKDKKGNIHIFYIELNINNKINDKDYILSFIDITNIKNMEQQLVQSEKMASLGTMIGNIAHQWRQPLSIITTSASGVQIQKEFGSLCDKDLNAAMETIINNSNYLSETIDTFRDFIKEEKELKEYNIQKVLDQTLKILQPLLSNNHIKLVNNINYSKPINKMMSSGELSQVITNLINNAKDILLEKNIEEPTIIIECYQKENHIFIAVEDNGGGIPKDIINQIFEPYFTTKHQSIGTGLGLYMSHKIVFESLKGNLYVKNTDKGAKFVIELPLQS